MTSNKQRGITLTGAIMGMIVLALVGLFAAKLVPSYVEYFAVQKILKAMESQGDIKGTVKEIRNSFDRRNSIENVQAMRGDDLEITKEGGETVVTATWSVKVPIVSNFSACLDFSVTTAK
jgi:type II secretory pathway pseudopilin PulG